MSASPTPAAPEGGPGTYALTQEGGTSLSVEVPVAADDPRLRDVEVVCKKLHGPPMTYLVGTVDNRQGTAEAVVSYVVVIDEAGGTVEVPYIANGTDSPLEESPYIDTSAGVDLNNSLINKERVRPGAKTELIFATRDKIRSVARVFAPLEELGEEVPLTKQPS